MIETLGKSNNHPCPKCNKKTMDWLHDTDEDTHYLNCVECKLTITLDGQNSKDILLIEGDALYGDIE